MLLLLSKRHTIRIGHAVSWFIFHTEILQGSYCFFFFLSYCSFDRCAFLQSFGRLCLWELRFGRKCIINLFHDFFATISWLIFGFLQHNVLLILTNVFLHGTLRLGVSNIFALEIFEQQETFLLQLPGAYDVLSSFLSCLNWGDIGLVAEYFHVLSNLVYFSSPAFIVVIVFDSCNLLVTSLFVDKLLQIFLLEPHWINVENFAKLLEVALIDWTSELVQHFFEGSWNLRSASEDWPWVLRLSFHLWEIYIRSLIYYINIIIISYIFPFILTLFIISVS